MVPCAEKLALLDAYVASVDLHPEMVSILSKQTDCWLDFQKALANAKLAGERALRARLAFEEHAKKQNADCLLGRFTARNGLLGAPGPARLSHGSV